MQVSMKLGEAMYKARRPAARARKRASGGTQADEGVVDAEFEEVSDDKPARGHVVLDNVQYVTVCLMATASPELKRAFGERRRARLGKGARLAQ